MILGPRGILTWTPLSESLRDNFNRVFLKNHFKLRLSSSTRPTRADVTRQKGDTAADLSGLRNYHSPSKSSQLNGKIHSL